MNKFIPSHFFNYENFEYKELFEQNENVWDAVKNLDSFIKNLFEAGKIKGNYSDNVYVGKNVQIDPTARIVGPAIIGDDSVIDHGAYLRENVIVGKGSKIGHAVEIKNSVVLDNAAIAHLIYVGDSIVGNNVNIGGGAMLANWRFDIKTILIRDGEEKIDTGLVKFGAILGDGCKIGVNAVLNPGTILGKNCIVFPLQSVLGTYEDSSRINNL